jgi:branched-chain amino acid aminotransferase
VLFLDALHRTYIEEMGGMNIMFVDRGRLRTPPLTDTILRGVTRESLLTIARDQGLDVGEDPITIDEVIAGLQAGTVTEMFACGTAAVVIGIAGLHFEDGSTIRPKPACPGPITTTLYDALVAIQYGRSPDRHGWLTKVCDVDAPAPVAQSGARR